MSFGYNGVDWMCSLRKTTKNTTVVSATQTGALIEHVVPVLHNSMHSNEMVRNTPKHKFWILWSGLDAFVEKKLKSGFGYTNRCVNSECGTRFAQLYPQ